MWPWKKSKAKPADVEIPRQEPEEAVQPEIASTVTLEDIEHAILKLRGTGFHFAISYAQMNGYDEPLTNPTRLAEIVNHLTSEPNFTDEGVDYAVSCQLSELSYMATNPAPKLSIPGAAFPEDHEDSEAREVLKEVVHAGNGDLDNGFKEAGFDFRDFLTRTVTQLRKRDVDRIIDLAREKKSVLRPLFLRAYSQGRNKYGEIELDRLVQEADEFIEKFFPEGSLPFFFFIRPVGVLMPIALKWVEEAEGDASYPDEGIDFEHWCAAEIEKQGWSATVSQASGDQGVDIVASRESVTVAVQCKRYNNPIGNKAVQEAFSGLRHYNADMAVVIGTGGFTRSAVELSQTTSVILLDADMIGSFTEQVFDRL